MQTGDTDATPQRIGVPKEIFPGENGWPQSPMQ